LIGYEQPAATDVAAGSLYCACREIAELALGSFKRLHWFGV